MSVVVVTQPSKGGGGVGGGNGGGLGGGNGGGLFAAKTKAISKKSKQSLVTAPNTNDT